MTIEKLAKTVEYQAALSFGLQNQSYKRYRLRYPEALGRSILERLGPDFRHLCVDIGSGCGQSFEWALSEFDHVCAVEPDNRLVETIEPRSNLAIMRVFAEEANFLPESVDLVTCGTAFHWMNGPLLLARIKDWLRSDGSLAVYQYRFPHGDHQVFDILRREMFSNWNKFKHPRLIDEDYAFRTIKENKYFFDIRMETIPNVVWLDASALIGFLTSTSFFTRYVEQADTKSNYLNQLSLEIRSAMKGETIAAEFPVELITASPNKTESD